MATTTNLNIPYLVEGQRSKEAAINDAYDIIDDATFTATTVPIVARDITANLPAASAHAWKFAISTDDGLTPGYSRLVFSDGTNWVRIQEFDPTSTL